MSSVVRQLLLAGRKSYGFSRAKDLIQQNAGDVSILIVGDSTGNETTEWVYLFAAWLAAQYPAHSVSYRLWNDTSVAYDAAVAISTGSGSNTIRIWNASVAGQPAYYFIATKMAAAVTGTSADLVIFNHGKNHGAVVDAACRGELYEGVESTKLALPNASVVAILQPPNRDDDGMVIPVSAWRSMAQQYGDLELIDVYSVILGMEKAAALYADNLHPSAAGTQVWLGVMQATWSASNSGRPLSAAFLSRKSTNLLQGADFWNPATFSGSTPPAGWTVQAGAAVSVESTFVDDGRSQSMKIGGTSAQAGVIQLLTAPNLALAKGGPVTLAVRRYVETGQAATVGRIAISYTNGGSTATTHRATGIAFGGYVWQIISGVVVPATATVVSVSLYCDTAANASSAAYYDRAILVPGEVPLDML